MLWGEPGQQPLGPAGHLGWALQGKVSAWMAVWEGSTHLWGWGMWAGTVLFMSPAPGEGVRGRAQILQSLGTALGTSCAGLHEAVVTPAEKQLEKPQRAAKRDAQGANVALTAHPRVSEAFKSEDSRAQQMETPA